MEFDALETILTDRLDADGDDGVYRLADDQEVTALLKTGGDLLHVNRLKQVEVADGTATLVTRDSEYFIEPGDLFALKLEDSRLTGDARPGFRRE